MGIFSRIRAALKALSGEQLLVTPYFKTVRFGAFTQEERADDLLKHFIHWVYICVSKNSVAVASVPLRLYVTTGAGEKQYKYLRKGIDTRVVDKPRLKYLSGQPNLAMRLRKAIDVEEIVEHPFLDLWRNVNKWIDGCEMLETLDIFLELTGDAYLYIVKDALGIPRELWNLPSQFMAPVPDKKNFIKGYLFGTNKHDAVALTPDEVLHFKFPNPHSPFTGFAPLSGCLVAAKRKEDYDVFEAALLQNNARPDFLIMVKGKMGEPAKRKLREQWQQLYSKRSGRGKPALLDTDAEVKTLGFSPKDMQYQFGQKQTKEEICGGFGVPVSKVVPDAKYSNAEVGDREWKSDTIRPRLVKIADKLNAQLMPMFDERLFVAFDNPVPADKEFEQKKEETYLKNAVITINEVREKEGKDIVPWGHVPLVPFNIMPLGSAPAQPAPGQPEETEEEKLKAGTAVIQKIQRPPMTRIPEMAAIMRRIYRGMETEVLANLQAGKQYTKAAADDVWFIFDGEKWIEEVAGLMGKPIKAQLVTGGQYGLDRLGLGLRFDVMSPEVQKWLRNYVAHFSKVTTRELGIEFSRNMLQGIEQGETIYELRKRTEGFFGRMKLHKSEAIARTESSRAAHHGMKQGWRQSGVVKGSVWRAQSGACDFCLEMDGKYTGLDTSYFEQDSSLTVGGQTLNFGYEEVQGPPLHTNCECSETAVLID